MKSFEFFKIDSLSRWLGCDCTDTMFFSDLSGKFSVTSDIDYWIQYFRQCFKEQLAGMCVVGELY